MNAFNPPCHLRTYLAELMCGTKVFPAGKSGCWVSDVKSRHSSIVEYFLQEIVDLAGMTCPSWLNSLVQDFTWPAQNPTLLGERGSEISINCWSAKLSSFDIAL